MCIARLPCVLSELREQALIQSEIKMPLERVNQFAFICTGPSGNEWLSDCYWKAHQGLFDVLREYGIPSDAIYRLSEKGEGHMAGVGLANGLNFAKIIGHLAKVAEQDDHIFIAIIGHGNWLSSDPPTEVAYQLLDSLASASHLSTALSLLNPRKVTMALNPCYSGGFIPKLREINPNQVIVTSTTETQTNAVGWIEMFTAALSLRGRIRGRSIKEIWEETVQGSAEECARRGLALETPELENDPVAATRYMGNNGKPLEFTQAALEQLRRDNASLNLV